MRIARDAQGFHFLRHGERFVVQGLSGQEKLGLAAQTGANTIRTYDTLGLGAILDSAERHKLAVIAGIYLPKTHEKWFYDDPDRIEAYRQNIRAIGARYGSHPALLAWCLGNELNFTELSDFSTIATYNRLLRALREGDAHRHPIGLATANYGKREMLNLILKGRSLDFTLINTFGRLPELGEDQAWLQKFWRKAFLIGEYGEAGPWEVVGTAWSAPLEPTSAEKAERLAQAYRQLPYQDPYFMGGLAFYWGQRQERTSSWFNFFNARGDKNALFYQLHALYQRPVVAPNRPPVIDRLSLGQVSDPDLQVYTAGESLAFEAWVQDPDADSLEYHWALRPEDWFFLLEEEPAAIAEAFSLDSLSPRRGSLHLPQKEGPYRLHLEVRDGQGHFATANIPLYVVLP